MQIVLPGLMFRISLFSSIDYVNGADGKLCMWTVNALMFYTILLDAIPIDLPDQWNTYRWKFIFSPVKLCLYSQNLISIKTFKNPHKVYATICHQSKTVNQNILAVKASKHNIIELDSSTSQNHFLIWLIYTQCSSFYHDFMEVNIL